MEGAEAEHAARRRLITRVLQDLHACLEVSARRLRDMLYGLMPVLTNISMNSWLQLPVKGADLVAVGLQHRWLMPIVLGCLFLHLPSTIECLDLLSCLCLCLSACSVAG